MTPLRLFVSRTLGHRTQGTDRTAISADCGTGNPGSRRLIHERHELVRKSWHGTTYANAAYVWTSADSRHPPAFRHIAVHYRSPASQLHDALRRAIHFREVA